MGFIEDTKELRSTYNALLKNIIIFNTEIKTQNKIQSEKKPVEIEDIDDGWFK